jgi:hypothetical protein
MSNKSLTRFPRKQTKKGLLVGLNTGERNKTLAF